MVPLPLHMEANPLLEPLCRHPALRGAFKQTTKKFHRIFGKPLSIIGFCQFRPSQFSAHSKAGFLGDAASPMESTIRSSEKSNSPCKLKCCQVTAEPWRMASISSARRFSFFSAATSRERYLQRAQLEGISPSVPDSARRT